MNIFHTLVLGVVFVFGVVTGGLSNVTSGGAGVLTTYVLVKYDHIAIQSAVGTVLAASTFIVAIGAFTFYRNNQVDKQLSITVGLAGVAGSFFAAVWASSLQSMLLERAFGAFTLGTALYTIYRVYRQRKMGLRSFFATAISNKGATKAGALTQTDQVSRWRGRDPLAIAVQVLFGTAIGIATGLFGVGGAGLTLVVLLFAFRLRAKMMLGTSLMASFFRYAGGSVGYLATGLINPVVFLILVVGGGIGSFLGARFVLKRLTGDLWVRLIVVAMLLFVSYEFLVK